MKLKATLLAAGLVLASTAHADDYPSRPIRLIAPFAPGGITDVMARAVATRLTHDLGQPVVVENRAGASGVIGAGAVARADPDGYTLLMGNISTLAINAAMIKDMNYDPVGDFSPISMVAIQPLIVAVSQDTPAATMDELVALAKSKPGELFYGTSGASYHLVTEAFGAALGIEMTHVPYKGSSPMIEALLGNHINVTFDPFSTLYGQVQAGKVKALALTAPKRSSLAPELPTVSETVLPGFEASSWQGIVAPAGTPRPIVDKLNEAIAQALRNEELKSQFAAQGVEPAPSTPEEFGRYISQETQRWRDVANAAGIQPQ